MSLTYKTLPKNIENYMKKGQEFTIKILSQPGIYEKCQ